MYTLYILFTLYILYISHFHNLGLLHITVVSTGLLAKARTLVRGMMSRTMQRAAAGRRLFSKSYSNVVAVMLSGIARGAPPPRMSICKRLCAVRSRSAVQFKFEANTSHILYKKYILELYNPSHFYFVISINCIIRILQFSYFL